MTRAIVVAAMLAVVGCGGRDVPAPECVVGTSQCAGSNVETCVATGQGDFAWSVDVHCGDVTGPMSTCLVLDGQPRCVEP